MISCAQQTQGEEGLIIDERYCDMACALSNRISTLVNVIANDPDLSDKAKTAIVCIALSHIIHVHFDDSEDSLQAIKYYLRIGTEEKQ